MFVVRAEDGAASALHKVRNLLDEEQGGQALELGDSITGPNVGSPARVVVQVGEGLRGGVGDVSARLVP